MKPIRFIPRRPAFSVLLVTALLALGVAAIVQPRLQRFFLLETGATAQAALALALEGLRSELDRAAPLAALVAERPILTELLRDPDNQGLLPFINEQLRQTALSLRVSDIYVMDTTGLTLAASNYRLPDTFIDRNFAFRPYFSDAIAYGQGRFHALGTTSGRRGYFFGAPIVDNTEILGVVAIKISLDGVEENWIDSPIDVIVTDQNNVIFLASRAEWHFRVPGRLTPRAMTAIRETLQYPQDRLSLLERSSTPLDDGMELVTIEGEEFVATTGLIASVGWRLTVLEPSRPAILQARQATAIIVLVILLLGLVGALVQQRRARLLERIEVQATARATLEARVAERTVQLSQEIDERRATEAELRRAQSDLVQAGKLAALGQMSAALSHEFNQPLAAVKAYADNAETFLDRDRVGDARRNIGLISQMADRMASISRHLRNFARRPQDKTGPIPLLATIDEALVIMGPRLEAAGAQLVFDRPDTDVEVIGGRVRLSQVLVNLISNALDAMEMQSDKRIEMSLHPEAGGWRLDLRDTGPGIADDMITQIFDPFVSSKGPASGAGLGLGLSISYNIMSDFGGALSARNHPERGAVFSVVMRAAIDASDQEVAAQ